MVAPTGWKEVRLGSMISLRTGKLDVNAGSPDGAFPFFTCSQETLRISHAEFSGKSVIVAGNGDLGVKFFDGEFNAYQRTYILQSLDERSLDVSFLYAHMLRYVASLRKATQGSTIQYLKKQQFTEARLLLPVLGEQQAIAEALSDADSAIESLDSLIAKKRDVKQAAMQQLLTGRTRLSGFSDTWKVERLDGHVSMLKGKGLSRSKLSDSGKFKALLYGELFTVYGRVIRSVNSQTDSDEGIASLFGDVLMPGSTTTTGEDLATASALLQNDVRIGGDVNIIRPDLKVIDPSWLAYRITNCHRGDVGSITQGITIHHLYGRDIALLLIPFPALDEQKAIVEILTKMDDELEALTEQVSKLRKIKEGMMQDLLTGKVRLV